MRTNETVQKLMEAEGRTQTWVAQEMNRIDPEIKMTNVKLSAIVTGKRTMSGDEMLAFCRAMKKSPDVFLRIEA